MLQIQWFPRVRLRSKKKNSSCAFSNFINNLFRSNLVRFLNNQNIFKNIFIATKHVDSVKYKILERIKKCMNISNY